MNILDKLAKSKFRSRFKLRAKELKYVKDKGLDTIYSHACDFIRDRVASADPINNGKQTPMRSHPVFIAQHATATSKIGFALCSLLAGLLTSNCGSHPSLVSFTKK